MPDTAAPDIPPVTYATAAQQRAYIAAMGKIRDARKPSDSVRVYISVPPLIAQRPQWTQRLAKIRHRLPGVELLQFGDLFTPENYAEQWQEISPTFDGLVVVGVAKRGPSSHVYRLGEVARLEVIDIVKTGRPVLLHARGLGLVPFVDCKIHRVGNERLRTKVTVPAGWDPKDYEPTLQAALRALKPLSTEGRQDSRTDGPSHLIRPFATGAS
ncbi:hypothetical protein [Streptomyces sp. NPDC006335]|uniref:hypothetical protein n=1 Tax=Streptomyces sp. NPDC006335 TaxID=3156895 RepID=UPI0033BBA722